MDVTSAVWRKSSYSGGNGGGCVEVAELPDDGCAIRDSKDRKGPRLVFSVHEWQAFTAAIKAGEFDLS